MKGSSLPSSCSFGSQFSFSEGTNTAHANLWQRRAVTGTQATPECHLRVPALSTEASLLSKCSFKPSHGGQRVSEADSSGGGWSLTPITQPSLLSHGFLRLPRRYPLGFFSFFLTRLQSSRGRNHFLLPALHLAWQDTGLDRGLLAATATPINQGCSLTLCDSILRYASTAPTANPGCGW